jgi:2,4'-dihydroxyacetophenone dioxygenase
MSLLDVETTQLVLPGEIPWGELWTGIEMKMLRIGGTDGTYTLVNRFAPGTVLPPHRHVGSVHAYTIRGAWCYREYDWVARAGDFIYEPPGSVHTLMVPPDGTEPTEVIFHIEKALIVLDDAGNDLLSQDGATIDAMYRHALESRGIRYPEGLVLP